MATKFKIRKGDDVIVLSGRDKGRRGNVINVSPKEARVLVQGVNMVRRHTRPSQTNPQGGILEKEAPLHISNVAHVDPADGKPTRVGWRVLEDGKKVRFAKRSGEVIDR
jgi:large subunit ribosomal protein L24